MKVLAGWATSMHPPPLCLGPLAYSEGTRKGVVRGMESELRRFFCCSFMGGGCLAHTSVESKWVPCHKQVSHVLKTRVDEG